MNTLGGYVTGKRGQVCVVPKLSRVIAFVQNPAPQGEKVAHRSGTVIRLGSLEDAHHRARAVTDACIRRASYRPSRKQTVVFLVEQPNRLPNS
jgi:hypothetical protein